MAKRTIAERIRERTEVNLSTGCLEWTGHVRKDGYVNFPIAGKMHLAHRVAYREAFGEFPNELVVIQTCLNRKCLNPNHLALITQSGRVIRTVLRGCHANGKLTKEVVPQIRAYLALGMKHSDIADLYGVTRSAIGLINRGVTWNHVE